MKPAWTFRLTLGCVNRLCCALDCAPHELPALLREAALFGASAGAVLTLAILLLGA